jgi:hypothetical protein
MLTLISTILSLLSLFLYKVRWRELKGQFVEVKWPYDNHVTPIKHACDALVHLNYRRDKLVGYKRQHDKNIIVHSLIHKFI